MSAHTLGVLVGVALVWGGQWAVSAVVEARQSDRFFRWMQQAGSYDVHGRVPRQLGE